MNALEPGIPPAAVALYWANLLALVFAPVFVADMNRFQIMPEERMLSRMFGPEFAANKQDVRRWV